MFKFFTKEVVRPFPVPAYIVSNVDNFNAWFNNPNNRATYAHSGIFLRLDKLSLAHILDYMEKCYGIGDECLRSVEYDVHEFQEAIRKDWLEKIKNK